MPRAVANGASERGGNREDGTTRRPGRYNATVRTETPVNSIFLANMAALWRLDPRLAQQIDDLPPEDRLNVVESKSGRPTACAMTSDGRQIYLHSRYDPQREACDFVQRLERAEAGCVVLCGLGLGYHIPALLEHFGEQTLIVVSEPDLVTIKTAMETLDLSAPLTAGRLILLTRLDKAPLHERLQPHAAELMLGLVLAVPPAAREHQADFHADCRKVVTDFTAFAKMSVVTLVRNAAITCRNIANNLPTYVSTPPADILRNRFEGLPAILVAAGPSLAKNMDQLAELSDRAILIAAQTTLRPLLSGGIRPHFVTSLDFSDASRQFFENLEIPEDLVLVAEPKAAWQVIDAFRGTTDSRGRRGDETGSGERSAASRSVGVAGEGGRDARTPLGRRVILLDNLFAHKCVGEAMARRTPMEPGATVMHLAFYLAKWLGCDPIIFVGQDLAFGGHVYYAPGVAMHRAWASELGRFGTLEMKEWERIARNRSILRKVRDIEGREIYTDEQMFTYLEQFERDFARTTARIIDATEGGARKAGAEVMPLREAAKTYCTRPVPKERFDFLRGQWHDAARLATAREELATRRGEVADFQQLCEETKTLLEEMRGLLDDPRRFNACVVRVDELRTLVQNHERVFQMVRDVAQLGELQKLAADRKLSEHVGSDRLRAERQIERDVHFLNHLLEGAATLANILDEAIGRFDEEIAARDGGSVGSKVELRGPGGPGGTGGAP